MVTRRRHTARRPIIPIPIPVSVTLEGSGVERFRVGPPGESSELKVKSLVDPAMPANSKEGEVLEKVTVVNGVLESRIT